MQLNQSPIGLGFQLLTAINISLQEQNFWICRDNYSNLSILLLTLKAHVFLTYAVLQEVHGKKWCRKVLKSMKSLHIFSWTLWGYFVSTYFNVSTKLSFNLFFQELFEVPFWSTIPDPVVPKPKSQAWVKNPNSKVSCETQENSLSSESV